MLTAYPECYEDLDPLYFAIEDYEKSNLLDTHTQAKDISNNLSDGIGKVPSAPSERECRQAALAMAEVINEQCS